MSNVNIVAPDSDYLVNKVDRQPKQDMDKDAFMQLLVTQLRYQDPMNPMDNQEMMAQMAQFSALEQMMNVANAVNKQMAHSMIGDFVQYQLKNPDTGAMEVQVGKIDYIKTSGSEVTFGIGKNEVKMEEVMQVIDPSNIQSNASAFELIGKTVQAVIKADGQGADEGKKVDTIIEGEVLEVTMKDEKPYVVIGKGKHRMEVDLEQVQNIVEKPSLTDKVITATIKDKEGNDIKVAGKVDYIVMQKDLTYLYVDGQFVPFDAIDTVKNIEK
ncbi:MAG: flagellar hook assembly protein FlgD [Cellulosilyticaceae bacterium]